MAKMREPKTGRWTKVPEQDESEELFDDTPDTQDSDQDFMKAIIFGIVAAAVIGLIFAYCSIH